jgi:hypothetical protein
VHVAVLYVTSNIWSSVVIESVLVGGRRHQEVDLVLVMNLGGRTLGVII